MHDGSIQTLSEAVDWELYVRGPQLGRPVVLTPEEKRWLLEFPNALTSSDQNQRAG